MTETCAKDNAVCVKCGKPFYAPIGASNSYCRECQKKMGSTCDGCKGDCIRCGLTSRP